MGESTPEIKTVQHLVAAIDSVAAAEAIGLAANVGLNTEAVFEHVQKSEAASSVFENSISHALKSDWQQYSASITPTRDLTKSIETANHARFSTPLASTAQQLYVKAAASESSGNHEVKLVQLYLPPPQGSLVADMTNADRMMTASFQVSKDTIVDLLVGIHFAAAIEAIAFSQSMGFDHNAVVSSLSEGNAVFKQIIPEKVKHDVWTLADFPQADDYARRLSEAVDKCKTIKYPCPMAAAALQQYHFANMSQKTVKNTSRDSR